MFEKIIQDIKIRKNQYQTNRQHLSTTYPSTNLYLGYYMRFLTECDIQYYYKHYDCFVGDSSHYNCSNLTTLHRITGENCNNIPIPFTFADKNCSLLDNCTTYTIYPDYPDIFSPRIDIKNNGKIELLTLKQITKKLDNYNLGNQKVAYFIAKQNQESALTQNLMKK